MAAVDYQQLALGWSPQRKSDWLFKVIVAISLALMLALGVVLSTIKVPEKPRVAKVDVPERIADFLLEKKKLKPPPPPPKKKDPPKQQPKPEKDKTVVKKRVEKPIKKPLTEKQKKAQDKAKQSGLLALSNELSDLLDTSDVSKQVAGDLNLNAGSSKAAGHNKSLLTADVGKGSGGVDSGKYGTAVGSSGIAQADAAQIRQALLAEDSGSGQKKTRSGNVRAEEGITLVFDRNKSKLYSLYNRARRKNPDLRGKIVLELTIAPDGSVTKIRMVSSELNDPDLERRIISRIKQFKFGAQKVKSITVTYPIEFLPS